MVLVRRHSGPGRVSFQGRVYEWGSDCLLDIDGQEAVALVRAHGDLSLDAKPGLHHDANTGLDEDGKHEEASSGEEE